MSKIGQNNGNRKLDHVAISSAFKFEVDGKSLAVRSVRAGELEAGGSGMKPKAKLAMGKAVKPAAALEVEFYLGGKGDLLSQITRALGKKGNNPRYTITITEMAKDKSVAKTYNYTDCVFVSLDFPTITASGGEMLMATATFKPQRLTVS